MPLNKQQLEQKFQEEYARLNEQQQQAVNTIEGPVMVIAGPGTGKTQILASRIGNILLRTDAGPDNILCLTYTDAGVVAMRRRLLSFIGADAYKVHICTFHAFCNEVIQSNLPLFEKNSLDPISDLERTALLKAVIDELPKNHPLKRYRGDAYYEVSNLQWLFSNMKKEGWTSTFLETQINRYLADLHTRDEFIAKRATKEFKKGDVRTDKIQAEADKMERLRAAAQLFDVFQEKMKQQSRYDFDDMINWVIAAFENNAELLARYQEQFLYILVDEYQDTSGTQNRIVELLINYWEQPNVFVVGDDDQSIYRFQGANVENMQQLAHRFGDSLLKVVLTHNYRSTQPILDVSTTLISNNQERLVYRMPGLSKELQAARPHLQALTHKPRLLQYETQRQELIGLTTHLRQLLAQGVQPGSIAVIYRENKYGEELARYLRHMRLPIYTKRHVNLFDERLVQQLLQLLRYLASEHYDQPFSGDAMLFELLHYNWWSIPAIEIARLSVEAAGYRQSRDKQVPKEWGTLRGLLAYKCSQPPSDLFSTPIAPTLRQAASVIEELITAVPNVTLQQLIQQLIQRTGLLQYHLNGTDKHWHLQVLATFFDFIKEETRRNPRLQLNHLVSMLDLMQREGISLPLVQVSGSEKGINLLTAHGSKGLEFEYVFVAGCNASLWEKKRKPSTGYALPDTLFAQSTKAAGSELEELRRLFYVALTRAEQHLFLSFSRFTDNAKELEPSLFVVEIREQHQLPIENELLSDEVLTEFAALQFQGIAAPELAQLEADFVAPLLESFRMNVTALNSYLTCPLRFYYNNLLRIPSAKNENTEFGSAIHFALQRLFERMKNDPQQQFPSREQLLNDFDWYMQRHRESFTEEQYNRRLEYGHTVLSDYYEHRIPTAHKVVLLEATISNVVVNGVPLKGKLDKLEFNGSEVNVVDYKSGDPEKGKDKLAPPNDKQPHGGDYWRQAVFYKLLVDGWEHKNWKAISAEFDFVEPDKKKQYRSAKIVVTPADLETVKQQITHVWQQIQDRNFYTGCGDADCHWCNFAKSNNLAIALHELEDAE